MYLLYASKEVLILRINFVIVIVIVIVSRYPKIQQRYRQWHLIQTNIPPFSNFTDTGEEPSFLHNITYTKHTHATRVQNTTLYCDGATHIKIQ